jgi:hypothetical protein
MKYTSGAAFRRALEDRLRQRSLQTGVPLVRLRKMVAFDRFLARLIQSSPDGWVLKGGLALQLRLEERARTTKDIDLLDLAHQEEDIHRALLTAGALDMEDWFTFEVARPVRPATEDFGGIRFAVRSIIDGRMFEEYHLDIGVGDPIVEAVEYLITPALLEFAEIKPTVVPCYPITQQIAEKVHAITRSHPSGEVSRVKDLVDILLMAELGEIDGEILLQALHATFDARQTHPLPAILPDVPAGWAISFRKMADEMGLSYRSLEDAGNAAKVFLNPIISGDMRGRWDPVQWSWRSG